MSIPRPLVRSAQPGDLEEIVRLHDSAFGGQAEGHIVRSLSSSLPGDAVVSLVAVEGERERIVGHILFSPVTMHPPPPGDNNPNLMGLAPLAVLPPRQKLGIGSMLARAGLKECYDRRVSAVFMLGHTEYYTRFEFEPASKWYCYVLGP